MYIKTTVYQSVQLSILLTFWLDASLYVLLDFMWHETLPEFYAALFGSQMLTADLKKKKDNSIFFAYFTI